ncbi:putative ferric-chelate reductase 1 [Patella vulgata]|uniref:putative ferric-chelate reductase 1 n=1 Tax=Patella vulgata TaxID=6465 RepID=UPI0024A984DD|nr:putative ferric-chelate reductase 1 [Patella vulgata]
MMEILLVLCFCLAVYLNKGTCYMTGAPFGTCLTMYPHHGSAVHQTTDTPFTITVDKATYLPDDELTVVIGSANDTTFKGLELKVHRLIGNQEVLEGQFTQFNTTKLQTQNCFGGDKNLITHTNNNTVTSLTIKWRAPSENIGDIQFTATVVESFSVFWFNVKAVVQAGSTDNIVDPVFQLPKISAEFTPVNFNTCGKTKGCFFHPHTCTGDDCTMAVTYEANDDDTYSFEMFGKSTNGAGYISTALSKDKSMGEDAAFVCSIETDNVAVRFAYNPRHYTVLDYTRGFTSVETRYENGNIYCRFTRNTNTTLHQLPNLNFDLSESHYLQMAYGETYSNTGQAKKHQVAPVVTKDLVYLKDTNVLTVNGPVSGAKTLQCIQLTIIMSLLFVWL